MNKSTNKRKQTNKPTNTAWNGSTFLYFNGLPICRWTEKAFL